MGTRDNFITRQLYYPYRMWCDRVEDKEIIPVFISYSDKTFYIHQYKFLDENQYNSLELVKSGAYVLEDPDAILVADALLNFKNVEFLKNVTSEPNERNVPFPQANDVRKVIDFIFAVAGGIETKKEVAEYYDFVGRQSDYYGNAARYLNFIYFENGIFSLTDLGEEYVSASKEERSLMMVKAMMSSPTINLLYKKLIDSEQMPDLNDIANVIQENRREINDTTAKRRAHSLDNWLEWMKKITS